MFLQMKTSYGRLCAIIYDLDKPYAASAETDLYTRLVPSKEMTILEPMCGSGRFLIPLLKAGYDVTGFDLSEDMLDACRRKCAVLKIRPRVFQADMRTFRGERKYNFIFIPLGSISLLIDDADLSAGIENIRDSLEEGGLFVFSFLNVGSKTDDVLEWRESMRYPYGNGEIICRKKQSYIEDGRVLDISLCYELIEDGSVTEIEYQAFPVRLFDEDEMKNTLRRCGFSKIEDAEIAGDARFTIFKCAV